MPRDFYQCDGRPHYQRKTFALLADARKQADKWENTRARYGTAGKYISERDATRVAEALGILAPHGAGIVDAARFYAELKTKLSQFLNFAERKEWIEKNRLAKTKFKRPPAAAVEIFDLSQVKRILEVADKSQHRATVLPYALVCLFAGLRPNREAEQLE